MDRVDYGSGMNGVDYGSSVHNWSGMDSVDGVNWRAMVYNLAALSDGGLGTDHRDGVNHRRGNVSNHGLVGYKDSRGGSSAGQEGGESNLERKQI
ncbi:unnamed protein product [Arctia plantaginis]|uniref:Uncharacterized protein n=1 Tax=Arctia plantaginis TaxID=874455 RepID=A0A8S0Z6M9_ARCPL|nr:unnamed protein product [Arctia plantaginis]CAB3237451.1 unnamed protein product [Arctia plantaginis]